MSLPRDAYATPNETRFLGLSVRWSAVFAGVLVALMIQLLLSILGAAIGLGVWDTSSGKGMGVAAGIWALISMLISLFVGGMVAGSVAWPRIRALSQLHGTLVWALMTLFTVWLVASGIGAIAGASFHVVGGVLGTAGGAAAHGISSAVSSSGKINMSNAREEIATILSQTGNPALQPESLRAAGRQLGQQATQSTTSNSDLVSQLVGMVQNRASTMSREDIVNVIVARTGKSRAEAERIADRVVELKQSAGAQLDTLKQAAGQKAEAAANVTSKTLWFALITMILSWGAAVWGARVGYTRGERNPDVV